MAVPTGRESDKFMLRLPDGMRERIKSAADANGRSMNAEIVATLEEKFPEPSPRHDLRTLLKASLEVSHADQPAHSSSAALKNRQTLLNFLWIGGYQDAPAFLREIEESDIDTSGVTIGEYVDWFREVKTLVESYTADNAKENPQHP
ncbi:Arc family DNA-binding protein [Pararhodobacter marinus]|uniref:Arc family DNA-binding protein n=1 Tax=Pararhodobacter marinus TaxID=2184063 RepID=UPI0035148299